MWYACGRLQHRKADGTVVDELANAQALAQQVIELTVQDSSCCSFSPLAQQFLSRTALARTQQVQVDG
jgi:hypothetical protein